MAISAGLALAAAFFFGSALVLTQFGLRHADPWRGVAISVPSATLAFWALSPWRIDPAGFQLEGFLIFAAVGALYPAVVTLLTFEANRRLGPATAGALGNLAPLFAVLAALAFGEAIPSPVQAAGLAAVVAGAVVIARPGGGARTFTLLALAIPLLGAAIRGAAQPAIKAGLALWANPFAAVLIGYSVSTVIVLVVARARRTAPPSAGRGRWWFVAVGLGNGCAMLLMYAALGKGPVTLVAPLVAAYPLFALAIGFFALPAQRPGWRGALGVGVVVVGVVLLLPR
jgi:drug/metabolite transporter (DMT)-like permease